MSFASSETSRQLASLVQIGTVASVSPEGPRADVQLGDILVPGALVGQLAAGAISFWWMPTVGEQVLVLCPGGDMSRAVIVCSIFAGNAPSADPGTPMMQLGGGTLKIAGNVDVTGDVVAGGISLITHTHSGVQTGGSNTQEPN